MSTLYNCHTHTFTNKSVPDGFFPLYLMKIVRIAFFRKVFKIILTGILPFWKHDFLNRLSVFIEIGSKDTQEKIFQDVIKYYPNKPKEKTKFVVLPMDMEYMNAGLPKQRYVDQIKELSNLKKNPAYKDIIIPFVAADPRRPDFTTFVLDHIDNHGFGGIKIYPLLGYYPFDKKFKELYTIAEERQIPIIAHCSPGCVTSKERITPEMRIHPKTGEKFTGNSKRKFAHRYADPRNYKYVLDEFPDLKICLAHFGGDNEWKKYLKESWPSSSDRKSWFDEEKPWSEDKRSWLKIIMDLMRSGNNIYADISYTAYKTNLLPLVKVLINTLGIREKILYGSDFYMVQREETEREFSINLRGYLGEDDFNQIARINPDVFLMQSP